MPDAPDGGCKIMGGESIFPKKIRVALASARTNHEECPRDASTGDNKFMLNGPGQTLNISVKIYN